jgi:hypothetical protein
LAGIGELPDTVADRAVSIRLLRKAPGETVARFKRREAHPAAEDLRARLLAWAEQALFGLADARPALPDELHDRAQDAVEPLLAIADLVAGGWPVRARAALVALFGADQTEESLGVRLLRDVRAAFDKERADKLGTARLLALLAEDEEAPWREWRGSGLTPERLAKMLKPYGIRPKAIRLEESTPRGYQREQFHDAWLRYLPQDATTTTAATTPVGGGAAPATARHMPATPGRNGQPAAATTPLWVQQPGPPTEGDVAGVAHVAAPAEGRVVAEATEEELDKAEAFLESARARGWIDE